jgi:aminoglycoside 3-N-acetyltransferase I
MAITILRLSNSDNALLSALIEVFAETFELIDFEKPPATHLKQLLGYQMMMILVAMENEKVIGGLTAYILPPVYSQLAEVYLYDLAVRNAHQRQGVGTLLIRELKRICAESGIRQIFVQADLPDKHAIDFYSKNGGVPEDVIHFSFSLR